MFLNMFQDNCIFCHIPRRYHLLTIANCFHPTGATTLQLPSLGLFNFFLLFPFLCHMSSLLFIQSLPRRFNSIGTSVYIVNSMFSPNKHSTLRLPVFVPKLLQTPKFWNIASHAALNRLSNLTRVANYPFCSHRVSERPFAIPIDAPISTSVLWFYTQLPGNMNSGWTYRRGIYHTSFDTHFSLSLYLCPLPSFFFFVLWISSSN